MRSETTTTTTETTTTPGSTSYDARPYPAHAKNQTHPDHLATVAALFGMRPPPVTRCRVLEIGCADGGNLIPMAYGLPESEFVGIDLSGRQIEDGQAMIDALGLGNISLAQADIMQIDAATCEPFDYIICHGVFSWVPHPAQEKIFEVCRRCLTPSGVAYISYNTYPGWHLKNVLRDLMRYHARELGAPGARVAKARSLLEALNELLPTQAKYPSNEYYAGTIKADLDLLAKQPDTYLCHEYLDEEANDPIYFHQFVERAAFHGLQYLAESDFNTMLLSLLPQNIGKAISAWSTGNVDVEQYRDFLFVRTFRQTLLCHAGIAIDRGIGAERVRPLYASAAKMPAMGAAPYRDAEAVMTYLAKAWPRPVAAGEIMRAIGVSESEWKPLGDMLLEGFVKELVELHAHAPRFVTEASERPVASSIARLQSKRSMIVTSLRHETVRMDDAIAYLVLEHLDGTRSKDELVDILIELAASGALVVKVEGERPGRPAGPPDPEKLRAALGRALDTALRALARSALLVG